MSDTPDYRQTRCDHGWVDQSQCRQCSVVCERDALRAEVELLRTELKALPKYNTTITVAPHIHHWVGDIPGELRCAGCGVVLKSED